MADIRQNFKVVKDGETPVLDNTNTSPGFVDGSGRLLVSATVDSSTQSKILNGNIGGLTLDGNGNLLVAIPTTQSTSAVNDVEDTEGQGVHIIEAAMGGNIYNLIPLDGMDGIESLQINAVQKSWSEIQIWFSTDSGLFTGDVTLPDNIKWINGTTPTFEGGKNYIISIVNEVAVAAEY